MDRVVDCIVELVSEMSDGQRSAEMTAAIHDLLIAIMHADHTRVQELTAYLNQFKHTGGGSGSGDGSSPGGSNP